MSGVRLILALHNHQPVGNFDGVFEAAYRDSYLPFLDVLEGYPEIPFSLHTSGPLMEWLVERKPEYVARLKALVASGVGVSLLPALALRAHRDPRVTVRALPGAARRVLAVTYGERPSPGAAAVVESLVRAAG